MKQFYKRLLFVPLLMLLLNSCALTEKNLSSTSWQLVTLNGIPVISDSLVTLQFEQGSLGGKDGCNSYGGDYSVKGSKLKIGEGLFSTEMFCGDEIMQQSNAYYQALAATTQFTIAGNTLTLLDEDSTTLAVFTVFTPAEEKNLSVKR